MHRLGYVGVALGAELRRQGWYVRSLRTSARIYLAGRALAYVARWQHSPDGWFVDAGT